MYDDVDLHKKIRFRRNDILIITTEMEDRLEVANRGHAIPPPYLQACVAHTRKTGVTHGLSDPSDAGLVWMSFTYFQTSMPCVFVYLLRTKMGVSVSFIHFDMCVYVSFFVCVFVAIDRPRGFSYVCSLQQHDSMRMSLVVVTWSGSCKQVQNSALWASAHALYREFPFNGYCRSKF